MLQYNNIFSISFIVRFVVSWNDWNCWNLICKCLNDNKLFKSLFWTNYLFYVIISLLKRKKKQVLLVSLWFCRIKPKRVNVTLKILEKFLNFFFSGKFFIMKTLIASNIFFSFLATTMLSENNFYTLYYVRIIIDISVTRPFFRTLSSISKYI